MTLRVRFFNPTTGVLIGDVGVNKASVDTGLGKTGEWTTEIPVALDILPFLEKGQTAQIFYQGALVIEGKITSFDTELSDSSVISIKGRDFLDNLYDMPADSSAVFKGIKIVQALSQLLVPAGWRLGDVSTMLDINALVTGDFRSEERLLPQIQKVINSVPKLTYRYGGMQAGFPTLDIGVFTNASGIRFYSPPNDDLVVNQGDGQITPDDTTGYLQELSYTTTLEDLIWGVEAYGGEVVDEIGVRRNISLYDAFRANTARLSDPDFPIMEQQFGGRGKYTTWSKSRYAGIGGRQANYTGANNTDQSSLGNPNAGIANLNYKCGVFFTSPGGYLRDFIVQFGTGSGGSITEPVMWWLYDSNSVFPDPNGTLLGSGSMGLWVPNKWTRNYFPLSVSNLYLPQGSDYALIFAFDRPAGYAVSTFRTIRYNNTNSAQRAFRGVTLNGATGVWSSTPTFNPNMEINFTPPSPAPAGAVVIKRMDQFAPERAEGNATASDCQAAGTALWEWTKRYIEDHVENNVSYKIKIVGELRYPQIGNTVEVHGIAQGTIIDPYTDRVETVTTRVDKTNLRVDGLSLDFNGDKLVIDMNLTEGDGITNLDFFVSIYDASRNQTPLPGVVRPWSLPYAISTDTPVQGNADPDTTMSDGRPAKLVNLPAATPPAATSTKVYFSHTPIAVNQSDGEQASVEVVSQPSEDGVNGGIIRICTGYGWAYQSAVNITANYLWY